MDWSVFERWRLEQKNSITTEKGLPKASALVLHIFSIFLFLQKRFGYFSNSNRIKLKKYTCPF
jgi:hypothetical protein